MKRRAKAGGKAGKAGRRKAATSKRSIRPEAVPNSRSAIARLTRERDEALDQQAASSEVLRLISRSPDNLQRVFAVILEHATRLCQATFGTLYLAEGDSCRAVAMHNAPPAFAAFRQREPLAPMTGTTVLARVANSKRTIQVDDMALEAALHKSPQERRFVELTGVRSLVTVPMLRDKELIGVVTVYRQEVRPFSEKQIELLKNFGSQAVIAIENARLLNELRQRTHDLSESLKQQTATSEVLRVITSSPGELDPVFNTILESATLICGAKFGNLWLREGDLFRAVAVHGAPPAYRNMLLRAAIRPGPDTGLGILLKTKRFIQIEDITKGKAYLERDPLRVATVELGGGRTLAEVPLLRKGELIGSINIYHQEVKPFTKKQIELLQNFASQAVIAIENARLLNELRESLEQQTATADVLRVISSSPEKLETVFQAMLANAVQICGAGFGNLALYDGKDLHMAAMHNAPPAYEKVRGSDPVIPLANTIAGPVVALKRVNHVHDLATEEPYAQSMLAQKGGARTAIGVPMLRDGVLVGMIAIYRQEVRPFTDEQIDLVKNFAAQAVIAIENTRLLSELRESLRQQTATADVLSVISSSPGELEPVFQAMLEKATRICEAKFGTLYRFDEGSFEVAALFGSTPELIEAQKRRGPFTPTVGTLLDRLMRTKEVLHTADYAAEPAQSLPARLGGARSTVAVPLLKDGALVGAFAIYRQEPRPFTDKQIELVKNFASQAVIAIENARLLNELRQRTDDLTESLEQQTATSEVLRVISSSPGQLEPVFQVILENAVRICDAKFGNLWVREGDKFRIVAMHGASQEYRAALFSEPFLQCHPQSAGGRVVSTGQVVQIDDVSTAPTYGEKMRTATIEIAKARTLVTVPMLKEREVVGIIAIYRQEVRPFIDKQIDLLRNFAAQAVIAIENTRLLSELRESLQQQTATSDVLKIISRSTFDLQTVLDTLVQSAATLCDAEIANIWRPEDGVYRLAAGYGVASQHKQALENQEYLKTVSIEPDRGSIVGRTLLCGEPVQVPDLQADADFTLTPIIELGGYRTMLGVPLLRDGAPIGVLVLARTRVELFTEKQIELVTTFADQAVIAIENVRLFEAEQQRTRELSESLERQTATSKVLDVISRSAFDLQAVFGVVAESSVRLCGADRAFIFRFDGELLRLAAAFNAPQQLKEFIAQNPIRPGRDSTTARAALSRRTVHTSDVLADPEFTFGTKNIDKLRTILAVPILKGDDLLGVLTIYHLDEVRPFTDKQIALMETFADQASIAIENVRLLDELRHRTTDLSKSLEDLRTAQDRLVQTQKLASLGQLTAGIAHEIKNPLNFVNNFSGVSVELIDELRQTLGGIRLDGKAQAEIAELTDTLRDNLDKITQHGKRADAIVKNMLMHSREGSGEHRPVDINALVDESLNLAYHGARAEKQGFNITLERAFDPAAGEADVYPQEISRVLINLISNGFYAATKRHDERHDDYEPTLMAATKNLGDRVEIRIRDNGIGIPPEVREKMFNPFFTTKPAGEGTGLGLSISHDIIVKQHSGSIEVDTKPGEFTEFRIILPRAAA